eukprot:CAMPEP_0181244440 /NCGR_PEP_ID=MMETSP1096-20121128/42863_1 /TAXON_ID=156174 ORGANISM="Chrysochromulina ericina, Strain CCMP281" /NCGR_SAMPLE_ID=MMETSP1096 /ASSEMBLY_ACC=CAM_ASM_000453 /LENGTH=80 /DNA_ID=CAMNT_0023340993 /DNA_START=712 /DNA_END=954 /DNA_ORIENTATION=-
MAMVTFPIAGTSVQVSSTPFSKFWCCEKLTAIAPCLSDDALTTNALEGTPAITMSACFSASSCATLVSSTLIVPGTDPAV